MLRITAYKKIFGSSLVLAIPELHLPPNIYWLQGENGSGKTTFIKSVAGLLPFDGDILWNDISLKKKRRSYTCNVNHAGAEPQYPSFLSGNDLIDFYWGTKKGNKSVIKRISSLFGMGHYLPNKVDTYSSGMTKKLCLLLAFIGDPKLILLDEPFTTLDVAAAKVLEELVQEFSLNGVSFCISSHQPLNLPQQPLYVRDKTIVKN